MNSLKLLAFLALATSCSAAPVSAVGFGDNITYLEDVIVKLTTALVKAEKYEEAQTVLKIFPNYDPLIGRIVKEVYDGYQSNIKNCLLLFNGICCTAYANGVSALYNEMYLYKHLSQPEILVFYEYLEEHVLCKSSKEIVETKANLQVDLDNLLKRWALHIRNNEFVHIYKPFHWQKDYRTLDSLSLQMPKLVQLALAEKHENFPKVFRFIQRSKYIALIGPGLLGLVEELKKMDHLFSTEMLQTAWFIHVDHSNITYSTGLTRSALNSYEKSIKLIPSQIRDIFWKKHCVLRNKLYREQLFANYDAMSLYTKNQNFSEPQHQSWIFESFEMDTEVYFRIKLGTIAQAYYVCMENEKFLCSNATDHGAEWKVKPILTKDGRQTFLLQNKFTGQYLTSATTQNNNELTRNLKQSKHFEDSSYWEIL